MEKETGKHAFRNSLFYRWMLNNKAVTALSVILLLALNILLISHLGFVFKPFGDFLAVISLPVIIAALFYYLLNPIVDFLQRHRVPRLATIIVIFIVLAGLIFWGLENVIPGVASSIMRFSRRVPHYVGVANHEINSLLRDPRFAQFRPQVDSFSHSIGNTLIDWSKNFSTSLVGSLSTLIGRTTSLVISIVIFPFVLFYLLRDGKTLNPYLTHFLPQRWQENGAKLLSEINLQVSNFVRGQVMVALSVMVMLLIGLPVVGLRYAIYIAIFSGVMNLIPFFGFFIALIPALTIALATGGPWMVLKVVIVYAIEVTLESRFISPLVLGSQLNIHPITILFILLTAEKIFGLWGVLLAIPSYAALKVIVTHIYRWYRQISELYDDPVKAEEPSEK